MLEERREEKKKVEKYQDLRREVARLWNVKVAIVVDALGAVTPSLSKNMDAAFTESSSPRQSAPPQTSTRGLRL